MSFPSNPGRLRIEPPQILVPRWKRTLDVLLILLSLPVVLPVALLIALLIRLLSSGPILFRQQRVGLQGREFMCLKFRTMVVGADTRATKSISTI